MSKMTPDPGAYYTSRRAQETLKPSLPALDSDSRSLRVPEDLLVTHSANWAHKLLWRGLSAALFDHFRRRIRRLLLKYISRPQNSAIL